MATGEITLLDIHKLNDTVGPLLELNQELAPAFARTPVKRMNGLSYKQPVRKGFPGFYFSDVGGGAPYTVGEYDSVELTCKHLDGQMRVLKSRLDASRLGENASLEGIQFLEADGFTQNLMIGLNDQFFNGPSSSQNNASKGFAGLKQLVASTMSFGMGGTSTGNASAYLVFENVDRGVSWTMPTGQENELNLLGWQFNNSIEVSAASGSTPANYAPGWTNACDGYLGLAARLPQFCIAKISNIKQDHILTDGAVDLILSQFGGMYQPTVCYMPKLVRSWLRSSRSPVTITNQGVAGSPSAPMPTEIAGIPIEVTTALSFNETAVVADNTRYTALSPSS